MQIARKLQCIADQFHRLHTQQVGMRVGGGGGFEAVEAGKPEPGVTRPLGVFKSFGLGYCQLRMDPGSTIR